MEGTKLSFVKAILSDEKKALKKNEVVLMEVPNYPEISVKNLYEDAMIDPEVAAYLPTKKQCSNKLPERDFFFGILCSKREHYMRDIIKQAHEARFKSAEKDSEQ
jgi:hypothetical protein